MIEAAFASMEKLGIEQHEAVREACTRSGLDQWLWPSKMRGADGGEETACNNSVTL